MSLQITHEGSYPSRLKSRNSTLFYAATVSFWTLLYNHCERTTQKTQSLYCWEGVFTVPLHSNGSYSIVACVFVAAGMCLPSRCLAVDVFSDFTPDFRPSCHSIFRNSVFSVRYHGYCISIVVLASLPSHRCVPPPHSYYRLLEIINYELGLVFSGIICTSDLIKTRQRYWNWSLTDGQTWPSLCAFFVIVRHAKNSYINSASTTVWNVTESSRLVVCRGESWLVGSCLSSQCLAKPSLQ
jgi:hypothetical protein